MKSRILLIIAAFIGLLIIGCDKTPIGFLDTENAAYLPDSMIVKLIPDPVLDANRIKNNSPWVSTKISGVLGTEPMVYSIVNVRSADVDEAEVTKFTKNVYIQGSGRILYPLNTDTKPGKYIITIGIHNAGDYYKVVDDVMTIIVK